jgi:hypothetical protein
VPGDRSRLQGSDGAFRIGARVIGPAEPLRLAAGETVTVTVELRITDCGTAGSRYASVTIDTWRGRQTVSLPTPVVRHNSGGYSVTTVDDPQHINGVQYLAQKACAAGP